MKDFTILVLSDSHGRLEMLQQAIDSAAPMDMIIHCGDGAKDMNEADVPEGTSVCRVKGNTDAWSSYDTEDEELEYVRGRMIFITHGHMFSVKSGLTRLASAGRSREADIILFGHTHIPLLQEGPPVLFNPGPMSEGYFGLITVSADGGWEFSHRRLGSEP